MSCGFKERMLRRLVKNVGVVLLWGWNSGIILCAVTVAIYSELLFVESKALIQAHSWLRSCLVALQIYQFIFSGSPLKNRDRSWDIPYLYYHICPIKTTWIVHRLIILISVTLFTWFGDSWYSRSPLLSIWLPSSDSLGGGAQQFYAAECGQWHYCHLTATCTSVVQMCCKVCH